MDIFDEIYEDFEKINGFNGIIVTDNGNLLYDRTPSTKIDTAKIQSMAKVISESSQKLLKRTRQGPCKTIILEFQKSNMILLDIENFHLLVLADKSAKLGHIILVSEKNRKKLHEIWETKKIPKIKPKVEEVDRVSGEVKLEVSEAPKVKEVDRVSGEVKLEVSEAPKVKEVLPEIKPPISLPRLEEHITIPTDENEKIELTLKIYEHLLLAMSIGTSKIMGVAPARGMLKKSLPYNECPILEGVEVKANSAIDFNAIISNIKKSQYRLEDIIEAFNKIIWSITDNYGRVMGYDAFRGMIRSEFKSIHEAYGAAIRKLGIIEGIHPELKKLWI